jgi:DNA polymerase-3 subunit delta'
MSTTPSAMQLLSTRLCPWLNPALQQLDEASRSGRLGHGWLITGPVGIGKLNLALAFAERLLRRSADTPLPELAPSDALTAMHERHVPVDHHPDLHWLFPEEEKRTVSVEQVRAVSEALTLTAYGGAAKVVVIEPAEGMTIAAANALLKTLEEPSKDTYLFLLSHQPGRLPATIRSRCQRLNIARPSPSLLGAWLGSEDPEAATGAWLMAGGSPLQAAALLAGDIANENRRLLDIISQISEDDADPRSGAESWSKADTELALTWLTRRLHREIRARLTRDVSTSITDRQGATLHNAWRKLTLRNLFEQYENAEKLLLQLGSGINVELALHALFVGFQANRGRP